MSLDPPTYLSSLQNNVRARPIPWDGAVRAGTITQEQLNKIKAIDKVRKDQRKITVENEIRSYTALFVGDNEEKSVLDSVLQKRELVQYILVLFSDLLDGVPAFTSSVLAQKDPYKSLLPLLSQSQNAEDPVPLLASTVLTSLIGASASKSPKGDAVSDKAIPKLFSYLAKLAKSSDSGLQDIAVLQYSAVLRGRKSRQSFWDQRKETVEPLIDILNNAVGVNGDAASTLWSGAGSIRAGSIRSGMDGSMGGGVGLQLLYHVLLVLWQLSFEGATIGEQFDSEYEAITLFTQLLRLSPKEKTTRLLVSTLYNLLKSNPKSLLPAASLARLPALLQNVAGRHLQDEECLADLKSLTEMLEEYTQNQTTFDEYAAEVNSGHLRWSPPHRSTTFWAENARRIIDHEKGELLKKLAEIISKKWDNDKQVLAIACNDIGCLVKEVPEKRSQLEKLGLKTRVMELMVEENETVRWESLKAVGEWLRYSFETK